MNFKNGMFLLLLLVGSFHCIASFTGHVVMDSCYDTTRRGYGFRVTNGPIVSRVNCTMYFEAPEAELYIAVRLNNVNLRKIGTSCPTFTVFTFSSWRTEPVPDEWRGSEVIVPADPSALLSCNCTNYLERCSRLEFDETKSPGLKIMLSYNPDDPRRTVNRRDAFDVTLSSFRRGASFRCDENYFACWHYKYRCLPNSLLCDGYDNCFDNSDEFAYSCTGRIANMTLPTFIVMLLACVVALAIVIWILVVIIRRRRANKQLARNEWGEVIKATDYPAAASSMAYPEPADAPSAYPMESLRSASAFEEAGGSMSKPMM